MKIAVLGCGNMGRAIISGLAKKGSGENTILAFDKRRPACGSLPETVTVKPPEKWFDRKDIPDVVIIAVKPQDIDSALKEVKAFAGTAVNTPLWLSIAAGVTVQRLQKILGRSARICRAMPNTPALIGKAATAYSLNDRCTETDAGLADKICLAFGIAVRVPEKCIDAVTGLSGSGPAYVFLFLESLIEAGVTAGLSYDIAGRLAFQTVLGATEMALKSTETPSQLKAKVMSPGGTTARGLMELEKQGFKYGIIRAVTAAAKRSAELGKKIK